MKPPHFLSLTNFFQLYILYFASSGFFLHPPFLFYIHKNARKWKQAFTFEKWWIFILQLMTFHICYVICCMLFALWSSPLSSISLESKMSVQRSNLITMNRLYTIVAMFFNSCVHVQLFLKYIYPCWQWSLFTHTCGKWYIVKLSPADVTDGSYFK